MSNPTLETPAFTFPPIPSHSLFLPLKLSPKTKSFTRPIISTTSPPYISHIPPPFLTPPYCEQTDQTSSYPEDFDRNYYPALKAQYENDPQVTIYSKDDYEIDPLTIPWLADEPRARDLNKIRKTINTRPAISDEDSEFPTRPFRYTDFHTEQEIEEFEPGFRTFDSVSGQIWEDPMPNTDFEQDSGDWIDFRKDDALWLENRPKGEDLSDRGALTRVQYASEKEELAAVWESVNEMEMMEYEEGANVQFTSWGEKDEEPDLDDFEKWQRAAEERGGNSTKSQSYELPPVRTVEKAGGNVVEVPPQFSALIQGNEGVWKGRLWMVEVSNEGEFRLSGDNGGFAVSSETMVGDEGSVEWSASLGDGERDLVSNVVFERPRHADDLVPGRAVAADGGYVCAVRGWRGEKPCEEEDGGSKLSMSDPCLRALVDSKAIRGEVEVCTVSGTRGSGRRRDRVILCSGLGKRGRGKAQEAQRHFSHVVLISECDEKYCDSAAKDFWSSPFKPLSRSAKPLADMMLGNWSGSGQVLQPAFPPLACMEHKTSLKVRNSSSISIHSVTWLEQDVPDGADTPSKARTRTLGKKKLSKRVAAARAHDQRRLSECSLLFDEKIGDAESETFAWKKVHDDRTIVGLISPRIGRFVDDYCGVFLPGDLLLTFPHKNAFPNIPNTICLTTLTTPHRKRIKLARNEGGTLVGALFTTESISEGDICDEVSCYV